MKIIQDKDSITIVDSAIRRVVKINLVTGYVNGKPVEALPPGYTDLVPSDHPVAPIARDLGRRWVSFMGQYAGRKVR